MFEAAFKNSSIDWRPSPVVALATSYDDCQIAAARQDGSLEIWIVSPGSVGWHCQLTIQGDSNNRVTSLVWCRIGSKGLSPGRLFSSAIDGSISEWDLFNLKQKILLESSGITVWQMALAPLTSTARIGDMTSKNHGNGSSYESNDDNESSESENDESETDESNEVSVSDNRYLAVACDNGFVRLYEIPDLDQLVYWKSLPWVSGRILSVTWSSDGNNIFSGNSEGLIMCWSVKSGHELYRITASIDGRNSGSGLCIWSLLFLRCGTLVSGDSSGSVQFWDSRHGTLLQAHSYHNGDVNALATAPSHNRVFSAGSDGQVILYKNSYECVESSDRSSSMTTKKWVYISYVRAHTHDVRALAVAVPISYQECVAENKVKRMRRWKKSIEFSYHKWAHLGVPMLISAGDDTKIFAYSVKDFTKFSPHDVCPAPQRLPIQMVLNTEFAKSLLLVQSACCLDIFCVRMKNGTTDMGPGPSKGHATTELLARIKSRAARKIICSCISNTGSLFAYSDNEKVTLFELKKRTIDCTVKKRRLLQQLPSAHSLIFSSDSTCLMIAGYDKKIYVVDVDKREMLHVYIPCHDENDDMDLSSKAPITKMFTSHDGQWLAAVNCLGDIYIFNLETQRQHWFIARLDGASITAGGFPPQNNNVLLVTTSVNKVYAFDIEAKQLGDWSLRNTSLPQLYQEFPGEVLGVSFLPASSSPCVVVYSAKAMCFIDFGVTVEKEEDSSNGYHPSPKKVLGISRGLKRRLKDDSFEGKYRRTFEFVAFRDPVLFIGHLSDSSVLIMDKPWMAVLKSLELSPLHRPIYGT